MATSQHRCVFVGNIPYDATEEQLIEICREVGPVVSFRLVIDRETGKPKGYGFCEYKDEETALSARRNLHGYEINGRQLRVDFAENDKGADRNREQGRGGPGLAANVEPQKQLGGPAVHGESVTHQPIGLHLALGAAAKMIAALGGAQVGVQSNQNGIQNQPPASDPLTFHLAKLSRSQLNDVMYELKQMATQNKEQARQLLLSKPLLLKAIYQAQIMLGMTNQLMPNLRQGPDHPAQISLQDGQQGQRQAAVQLPGLPPLAQKMQFMPKVQEGHVPAVPQHSYLHNQFSASLQPATHPQVQLPQHAKNQVLQQVALPGVSGAITLPPTHPLVRPQVQVVNSSSLNQQIQPPLENPVQVASASLGHNSWINTPSAVMRPSILPRPDAGFQPGPAASSGIVQTFSKDADRSAGVPDDASWADRNNSYSNMHSGLAERTSMIHDPSEFINRPAKMLKVDGSSTAFPKGSLNPSKATGTAPSQAFGVGMVPVNPVSKVEEVQNSEKQTPQSQLPSDVESVLLQQVLSLTPEQLSSLPPEQREQVIQLQRALLRDQMQLS